MSKIGFDMRTLIVVIAIGFLCFLLIGCARPTRDNGEGWRQITGALSR